MKTRITTNVVAASMGLFLTLACAQTRPLTAELMSKAPQISSLNISPKGMQFAAWTNRGDSNVLIARSVSGGAKARALLAIDSKGVTLNWYAWVSEERLLASVTYPTHGAGRMTHLLSIPADGSPLLDLISPKTMGATGSLGTGSDYIVDWMPEDGQHVLVQLSGLNATNFPDVYEFDLRTGEHQVRHKAQRYTQSWLTDRSHRIRVAIRVQDEKVDVQVSDEQGLNWRSAWSYAEKDRTGLIPLGFGSDPNLLYVNAILDGRRAIFEVDLRDPGLKLIPRLSSPSKDIFGSLVVDGKTGRAVGVRNLEDSLEAAKKIAEMGLADGLVFSGILADDPRIDYLVARDFPFVSLGRCRKKLAYAHVDADHAHAAEIATARLIAGGHRRIALINPHRSLSYARDRMDGFRAAFRAAGISPSADLVAEGDLSTRFGMLSAERMSAIADPATAFVCVNESTALGVIAGLNRRGRRISEDVSVIAFDDINVSGYFNPPLTTLYHPIEQQGRKLGEFLLRRIAGEAPEKLRHVFRPELIVRQNDQHKEKPGGRP